MVTLSHFKTTCFTVLGVCSVLTFSSCSLSNGAGSASDSSGSSANSSGSSANSSKGDSKAASLEKRYTNQVQDFTANYVQTNPNQTDQAAFFKGISEVAAQNGIIDWEAQPTTFRVIGKGLKKANVSSAQYEVYKNKFTHGDIYKIKDLQQGYEN